MDDRSLFMRLMRREFGNLLSAARIKIVTIDSVSEPNSEAVVTFAKGDVEDPTPDPQTVPFLSSYYPIVGQQAYLMLAEGAPVLIGAVEDSPWNDLTLPPGYSTVAGYTVPAYRRDSSGRVWFRGGCNIASGNVAGNKFTLASGYRPKGNARMLSVPYSNGTAITGHLRYDVSTLGVVSTPVASPGATVFASFEGISFDIR
jgi:hypothetical protein